MDIQAAIDWFAGTNVQSAIIGPTVSGFLGACAYAFHQRKSNKVVLSELIQEIERLAVEHWCSLPSDTNNRARCIEIQHKFKTLAWRADQNREYKKNALKGYRQAVTGGDFEDPNRPVYIYSSQEIKLICQRARRLRKDLKIKKHH